MAPPLTPSAHTRALHDEAPDGACAADVKYARTTPRPQGTRKVPSVTRREKIPTVDPSGALARTNPFTEQASTPDAPHTSAREAAPSRAEIPDGRADGCHPGVAGTSPP
jgi:hypothetical protein